MIRRKPTPPAAVTSDPRFTLRGRSTVQTLPPSVPNPRKRLGHAVKYRSPSQPYGATGSGSLTPIPRRVAVFFGIGGRVGWRK